MKLRFLSGLVLLMLLAMWGCDVTTTTAPDKSAPAITITYPADWSTIYSSELTAHFEVEDEHTVDSLTVYVNGERVGMLSSRPYQLTLQQIDYPAGLITLYAEAMDSKGNSSISRVINFYWMQASQQSEIIVSMPRPVVWENFTTPEIPVLLNVESSQPVASVQLFVDGMLYLSFDSAPYDTTLTIEQQGTHNIYAQVIDELGTMEYSDLVTFEVVLEDVEAPTGFISFPADWADVSGTFEVRVTAVDNNEIDRVELYADGLEIQELFSAPYHFNLNATTLTLGTHTLFARIWDEAQNSGVTQMVTIRVIE